MSYKLAEIKKSHYQLFGVGTGCQSNKKSPGYCLTRAVQVLLFQRGKQRQLLLKIDLQRINLQQ